MLEVNIKLDYNDLKLLKAMTKLGDNKKLQRQSHMPGAKIQQTINFVVQKNKLIVWVSDSYVLGMTTWNSQERIHIASSYVDKVGEAYVMSEDEIWYSIRGSVYGTFTIEEFNAKLTHLFKYFSAKEVDGHTYISLNGNQQFLTKDILNDDMEVDHTIDVGVTVDNLTVRIDNIEPYIITT